MNLYNYFFLKAKEANIDAIELSIYKASSTSISLYHGEIENVQTDTKIGMSARGIFNNKFGIYNFNVLTKENIPLIIDSIKANATLIEKDSDAFLFKGSKKYHKVNTYSKVLSSISIEDKKQKLFELEKLVKEKSDKVSDIESTTFSESESESILMNSYGLNLKQKNNYFFYTVSVVCKENEETKTNWDYFLGNDFNELDINKIASRVVTETIEKFGGKPIKSSKKPVILAPNCVATLLSVYLGHAVAEEVQKHTSLFEGKLNTQIASKKLTVIETPLNKTIFSSWFDDEGVATYNKDVIKNGVLKTYFYNLETAAKDGVESTGNAVRSGSKMGTGFNSILVKPGKKSLEELCEIAKEGIIITDIQGAHAGINPESGNFSLQAEGFLIKNGKKSVPISLITISGNLLTLFNDIKEIGNDSKMMLGGTTCPSLLIKNLSIGGK